MAPVPGGHALHRNRVARLQRVLGPAALLEIDRTLVSTAQLTSSFPDGTLRKT